MTGIAVPAEDRLNIPDEIGGSITRRRRIQFLRESRFQDRGPEQNYQCMEW
jgi:hypothetical protein